MHTFDPRECLPPAHAERERRLGGEWARPQGVQVDFPRFWREVRDIVMTEGRKYPKVVLVTGTKAG